MAVKKFRKTTRRRLKIVQRSKEWYDKKYSVKDLAVRALNGVKYLRMLVNAERKYYDLNQSASVDNNGTMVHLTPIPQGDGVSDRSGIKVAARSLYIRTNTYNNNTINNSFVRFIIFFDKFNTGTAPAPSDIISTAGSGHVTTSPLRLGRGVRYDILYDKVMTASNTASTANARNIFINLFRKINYSNSLGTDTYSNQLYMLMVSQDPGPTAPTVVYSSRFGYMDN